jgi:NitT/TauT family transport system ATP-binding protein
VTHDLAEAVQLADRLFFLSDRPTRVLFEKSLPPPRGSRSKEVVAAISDDMRAQVARVTTADRDSQVSGKS